MKYAYLLLLCLHVFNNACANIPAEDSHLHGREEFSGFAEDTTIVREVLQFIVRKHHNSVRGCREAIGSGMDLPNMLEGINLLPGTPERSVIAVVRVSFTGAGSYSVSIPDIWIFEYMRLLFSQVDGTLNWKDIEADIHEVDINQMVDATSKRVDEVFGERIKGFNQTNCRQMYVDIPYVEE